MSPTHLGALCRTSPTCVHSICSASNGRSATTANGLYPRNIRHRHVLILPSLRQEAQNLSSRCQAQSDDSTPKQPAPSPPLQSWGGDASTLSGVAASHDSASSSNSNDASRTQSSSEASTSSSSAPASSSSRRAKKPALRGMWKWLPNLLLPPVLPPKASVRMLARATQLLKENLVPILIVYALKDTASFLLHRLSQRMTNAASDALLGTSVSAVVNPWWLYLDSAFLEAHLGYQVCIVFFFLAALPLNILLNSAAAALSAIICTRTPPPSVLPPKAAEDDLLAAAVARAAAARSTDEIPGAASSSSLAGASASASSSSTDGGAAPSTSAASSNGTGAQGQAGQAAGAGGALGPLGALFSKWQASSKEQGQQAAAVAAAAEKAELEQGKPGLLWHVTQGLATARSHWPEVAAMLKRVWWVDVLFNMRALPLQALSLAVIPVFWTVPRLLAIQLALPVAVLEGKGGKDALARSGELMANLRAAYGWPFVTIIVMVRLLDVARNSVLAAVPGRWWQEVIEVPLALTAVFSLAKLLVIRLQDLLPLAAYLIATSPGKAGESEGDDKDSLGDRIPAPPSQVPTI